MLGWYDQHARDLPWRRTDDPYRIWLSEVMLQQTRVETVVAYYHRWLTALPDVAALAAADEEQVLKLWEGLGYYRRARNFHRAAQQVVEVRGGSLPTTARDWLTLPGIGRYTAGAIASIAYGERVPVVDGNVKRVLARLFSIHTSIDDAATIDRMWNLAEALVPASRAGDFNQALMELGARVCTPRNPDCTACPLRSRCQARRQGQEATLPLRRPRRAVPHEHVAVALIQRGGRYLVAKRPPGLLGGLWEFPGTALATQSPSASAVATAVAAVFGRTVDVGARQAQVDHAFTHKKVTYSLFPVRVGRGEPSVNRYQAVRWVRRSELADLALPKPMHKLLAALWPADPTW